MLSVYFAGGCPRLARPELVRAARPGAAGVGPERDRRRGDRRHGPAPDRRIARVDQPRAAVASGGPSPCRPDDQVYVDGYAATQRHFIEGLLTGAEHETRASDNLKTMDVIWAAYRSAEEGRTLSV